MQLTLGIVEEPRPISGGRSPIDAKFHVKHIALGYLVGNNLKPLFPPLDSSRCVVSVGAHPPSHLEIIDGGVEIVNRAGRNQLPDSRQTVFNGSPHIASPSCGPVQGWALRHRDICYPAS